MKPKPTRALLASTGIQPFVNGPTRRAPAPTSEAAGTEWQADAACRTRPEVSFFPETREDAAVALAICAVCLVRQPCDEYARATHAIGVWGGRLIGYGSRYAKYKPDTSHLTDAQRRAREVFAGKWTQKGDRWIRVES